MIRDEIDKARLNMPLASRKDIEALSEKIDALAVQVEALSGEKPAKKPSA
jgi:polyhydroxyalkanoate synthesis regulator phasin